jgi:hypothetical protein
MYNARNNGAKSNEQIDSRYWGNPVDVPNDDLEKYYLKQNFLEKEENERAMLIKSFHFPIRNKLKGDFLSGKSKKIMSISTLRPTAQRSRRRRRRQVDLNFSADCSLEGHYNFIEKSSSLHSKGGTKTRKSAKAMKRTTTDKQSNTLKAVQKSGLVNTKISIYEKNLSSANDNSKRKKTVLGVPLIGMRDTDPIVTASTTTWKNYGTKDPLQLYITDTKTSNAPQLPSTINVLKQRERMTTKRKAPSIPNSKPIAQATPALTKDDQIANDFKYSSNNSTLSYPIRFTRNPYLTTKDEQLRYVRDVHQLRGTARASPIADRSPMTFIRSPSHNGKRKTLYAKDTDRDEAIRVLTNLCLNPLARNNKRASFMIW